MKVAGCDLFSGGEIHADEHTKAIVVQDEFAGAYKKVLVRDGKVVGVVLYGDVSDGNRLFNMLKKGSDIQEYTSASVLHKAGDDGGLDVAAISADETICGCNGVTKGRIVGAILEHGLTTFDEVKSLTKAGGSCGKCRGMVEAILAHTLGDKFDATAQKAASACAAARRCPATRSSPRSRRKGCSRQGKCASCLGLRMRRAARNAVRR